MIRFITGNLFESNAQALVNTVNCVGVMGKGIAYQFKRAFPAMFKDYAAKCRAGDIKLGAMSTFREGGRIIINFPTKQHWRSKSRLEDIESGLHALKQLLRDEGIQSVAIPPLGCGNGGLKWADVKPQIARILDDESLANVDIEVYEPVNRRFESKVAKEPPLYLSHYVLAALSYKLASRSRLQLQKAAYFFNVFVGEEYFKFKKHKFGPYCQGIEPMGNAIRDYLAYTKMDVGEMIEHGLKQKLRGTEAERLRTWLPTIGRSAGFCNQNTSDIEALATVHAIVAEEHPIELDAVVTAFFEWSEEKSNNFTRPDVVRAVATLERRSLIRRSLFGYELHTPGDDADEARAVLSSEKVTISLPADLIAALDNYATRHNSAREQIIRESLQAFLTKA
jgi:O-acetyl-ADP-ribose deacetylase (regulator of RNase III)/uncharacterized protein YwgA